MKILHLDSGREMRGGQWQVIRLHAGLVAAGHQSMLLARPDAPLFRLAQERQLPIEALTHFKLAFSARGFDLLHAHDARTHTMATLLGGGRPLVVARRVAFPVRSSAPSRWKYRHPRMFLAVSNHVADKLRESRVLGNRIAVVYDGVPIPRQPAMGTRILVPQTADPRKGMALAFEGAGLAGIQLSPTADLESDLPNSAGLVYLSESEGLGSGILLAMAHGVPVIASNVGGIPEIIEDGVTGVLTRNDPTAVAEAFSRWNRQMGIAARQSVVERFTVEQMVRDTLAAYERVLA